MQLRKIDLNLLILFDALIEERSVTRTAQRLSMTQPALSNALNRLREMLGDPLFERTREFGTLRAIGDRSTDIFRLIVAESACLGLIGALAGMLLGCLMALAISSIGIPMPPPPNANLGYTALIRLDALTVLSAGAIGFTACLLASLLPAHRASKLDIGEALRHGV